ncbi:hypothetical protein [Haladaptatus litoreus]|uniref:hypothetical protein n=1 Tax=Haladaptatus litoreus TaxID=553468 RepID=UPI00111567A9|nr:hypothetical protein [Haladaptatus litoreus]
MVANHDCKPRPNQQAGECAALARQVTGRTSHSFRKDEFPPKAADWLWIGRAGRWPARPAVGSFQNRGAILKLGRACLFQWERATERADRMRREAPLRGE